MQGKHKKFKIISQSINFWKLWLGILIILYIVNAAFAGANLFSHVFEPQLMALLYTIGVGVFLCLWIVGTFSYIPDRYRMFLGETIESTKNDFATKLFAVAVYIHIVYGYWTIIVNHPELNEPHAVQDDNSDYYQRLMAVNGLNLFTSYGCAILVIKTIFFHRYDVSEKLVTKVVQ